MSDNQEKTWQQEEREVREQDKRKLFKGVQYPSDVTEEDIDLSESILAKVYAVVEIITGAIVLAGILECELSMFLRGIIMALVINKIAKVLVRKASVKLASFLKS